MDVNLDDILMQSPRRDPLNVGTAADHKKADWFADLWKEAVSQRKDDAIHIRGLHYVIIQMEQDVEPPTSRTSWDRYKNTEKCYDYLISAGTRARILGYVPVGGISDEKNNQERVTEYTGHSTLGDSTPDDLNPTDKLSIPSIPDVNDTAEVRFDDIEDLAEKIASSCRFEIQCGRRHHRRLSNRIRILANAVACRVLKLLEQVYTELVTTLVHVFRWPIACWQVTLAASIGRTGCHERPHVWTRILSRLSYWAWL
jgi:hypothetical protein